MISDRCCDPLHMNVFLWIVASQLAKLRSWCGAPHLRLLQPMIMKGVGTR